MLDILFSADWHIKLGQKNVPIEWQTNRYRTLFEELYKLENNYSIHIIGGDIFDSVPTMAELALFTEYLIGTNKPVWIFSGNHEATKRGATFFADLEKLLRPFNHVQVLLGKQTVVVDNYMLDIIPYEDLKSFEPNGFSNDILLTHVRGEIIPHVKPEIDLSKLDKWKRVFAGDLHSHSNTQRNIVYPGSPVTTSFHRQETNTGVILFNPSNAEYKWVKLNVPQLIRKTVSSEEEMVRTEFHHTIYELQGDIKELSKVTKSNPLLDKKVVKRKTDAKLDFSKTDSVRAELALYLKDVIGIKDNTAIMGTYDDYST